jgi:predicted RNA-binding Zn ribbon-like protein
MESGSEFLFVGGRLWLDFVNTEIVVHGERRDLLSDFGRWMAWQAAAGMPGKTEAKALARRLRGNARGAQALTEAAAFRTELRRMAGAIASRQPIPDSALQAINDLLRRGAAYGQLIRAGRRIVRQVYRNPKDSADLLVPIAEDAADLLCEGDPGRIRKCGNPACILFFDDTSRSRTRRWCSMKSCGNRAKVAAHYRRRRARAGPHAGA